MDPLLNCDRYLSVEDTVSASIYSKKRSETNTPVSELSGELYEDHAFLKIPEYLPDEFCKSYNCFC